MQHLIRLGLRGVGDLLTSGRSVFDATAEPDRAGAVPTSCDLFGPSVEVRPLGSLNDLFDGARREDSCRGHR
jgi:hypothetical protein